MASGACRGSAFPYVDIPEQGDSLLSLDYDLFHSLFAFLLWKRTFMVISTLFGGGFFSHPFKTVVIAFLSRAGYGAYAHNQRRS